jgi:hypothetical protein
VGSRRFGDWQCHDTVCRRWYIQYVISFTWGEVTIGADRMDECQACRICRNFPMKGDLPRADGLGRASEPPSTGQRQAGCAGGVPYLGRAGRGVARAVSGPFWAGKQIPSNWDNLPTERVTYPTGVVRSFRRMILKVETR